MPQLDRQGDVFVLDLGSDENRFNQPQLDAVLAMLDQVEAEASPRALVTTATGKFWSNGLDLDWMAENTELIAANVDAIHELYARVLELSVPTVAAVQGHAFGGGAMLALAHDQRIMRSDRGYFCLPEVDIQIPFTPGMSALVLSKLSPQAANEAMTTGRRYGGGEAAAAGIVQRAVGEDEVRSAAVEIAAGLASKDGNTLGVIKQRMYGQTLQTLRDKAANGLPKS
ncbi:MAG: enoyl-CoA hydratase/isomerase family protein [Thermoleophilaceae bacterium]|nr:enoyl-CoA hydratase/isomerase family protein [Thermoleophilaceae bacterium]